MTQHSSSIETLIARRAQRLGPNVSTFYDEPVHLVKGQGVWVWDNDGRKYLVTMSLMLDIAILK